MGSLLTNLFSLSIASAMGPGQILFVTLLLRSPNRGVARAALFVGGMTAVRLIQGVLFGLIFAGVTPAESSGGQPGVMTSTLLLVLGILLLVTAFRKWRHGESPDDTPPAWLSMIDDLTPLKAMGIGFILVATSPNLWVFTLGAISAVSEAGLSLPDATVAFLLFVLVAEALVLLPILFRIVFPKQAQKTLEGLSTWLTVHDRVLIIGISVVFGLFFLVKGIVDLQGAGAL